jgi:hypothetical protein
VATFADRRDDSHGGVSSGVRARRTLRMRHLETKESGGMGEAAVWTNSRGSMERSLMAQVMEPRGRTAKGPLARHVSRVAPPPATPPPLCPSTAAPPTPPNNVHCTRPFSLPVCSLHLHLHLHLTLISAPISPMPKPSPSSRRSLAWDEPTPRAPTCIATTP